MRLRLPTGKVFSAVAVLAAICMFTGCSTTTAPKENAVTGQQPPVFKSGFLGDYSQLKPGGKDKALLVYINPAARWATYKSIIVEPVRCYSTAEVSIPASDQQVLASYFYNALRENLAKDFTLVDKPGPGVLKLQTAITDATASKPVLRTVSVVIPQARVLNGAQSLATGTYAFAGNTMVEGQIVDSVTGERLAAALDKRAGGMSVKAAAKWEWGDTQLAFDYWAKKISQRLVDLKEGKPIN